MSKRPARACVRRKSMLHDSQRAFDARIGKIGKIQLDLIGRQHSFVDDRSCRKTRKVEVTAIEYVGMANCFLDAFADQEKPALESISVGGVLAGRDEDLP